MGAGKIQTKGFPAFGFERNARSKLPAPIIDGQHAEDGCSLEVVGDDGRNASFARLIRLGLFSWLVGLRHFSSVLLSSSVKIGAMKYLAFFFCLFIGICLQFLLAMSIAPYFVPRSCQNCNQMKIKRFDNAVVYECADEDKQLTDKDLKDSTRIWLWHGSFCDLEPHLRGTAQE